MARRKYHEPPYSGGSLCDGCGEKFCMSCNPPNHAPVKLARCACDDAFNLPMWMEDEEGDNWIECDNCGKRTGDFKTEEKAAASWNLIAGG